MIAFVMTFVCALTPGAMVLIPPLRSFAAAHPHPQGNTDDLALGVFIVLVYGVATILALVLCYLLRRIFDRGRGLRLRLLWALWWPVCSMCSGLLVEAGRYRYSRARRGS